MEVKNNMSNKSFSSSSSELDKKKFSMFQTEQTRYVAFFTTLDQDRDEIVSRKEAMSIFQKSTLSENVRSFVHVLLFYADEKWN